MKIRFLGAAQNITGSKHLIQTNGYNLLLDCGFYQGRRKESNEQNQTLPFNEKDINAVILSHAHLDHCGTLPVLVKNGFVGKIYCTAATAEITKQILLDSAGIQFYDAEYFNKHIKDESEKIYPIYTEADVNKTLEYFETVDYFKASNKWTQLNENIRFKFYDAGHILGSAITLLEIKENNITKTLVFTGDLGRDIAPILRSPESIEENIDAVISECTYGDRLHEPVSDVKKHLSEIITEAVKNKSKIIIPAFSLGRTQEIVYVLHKLFDENKIPSLPVFVDSPLATDITEIFARYTEYFDEDFWKDFGHNGDSPFSFKKLIYTRNSEESKALNKKDGPFIVISASGMAEGGRVLHHLKNNIGDKNNIVLIVGYQAENTLGRRLQDGVSPVKIYGEYYDVKAKIITLHEFSAHADQQGLLNYIKNIKNLKKVFLVHTELQSAKTFEKILKDAMPSVSIEIPSYGQSADL